MARSRRRRRSGRRPAPPSTAPGRRVAPACTGHRRRFILLRLLSVTALAGCSVALAVPASAAAAPLSGARVVAHFASSALQNPENITLQPGGAADVTFTRARQIAQ